MPIVVKAETPFKVLYNLPDQTNMIICIGGRGGMKTYEVSKFVAKSASVDKKRCVILRDEKALIKESILNEILTRYDTADKNGQLSVECDRQTTGLKCRRTGTDLVFTKGFRASDNQKKANMKGVSDIDIAVIEEAEDIRDPEKFNTFIDSLRKEGCLIIVMMNTPDIGHFLIKQYFNAVSTEHDGYFRLEPKKVPGFVCIQTSFKDNKYLPKHIVDRYNSYGDPTSNLYNLHYYLTSIVGLASTGRKGQILRKVKPISLVDYLKLPFKEIYGLDFGTASPAGIVGVKIDKNNCWARQINYLPMNTLDIGKLFATMKLNAGDRIVADCADAKAIKKLKSGWDINDLPIDELNKYPQLLAGFHVIACTKGTDSITNGLSLMDGMNLFAVEESKDLWNEILNYVYDQDKNMNYTNDPKDDSNHLIDPWRYVVNDQRGKNTGYMIHSS